jgi:hypothetical protein
MSTLRIVMIRPFIDCEMDDVAIRIRVRRDPPPDSHAVRDRKVASPSTNGTPLSWPGPARWRQAGPAGGPRRDESGQPQRT